MTTRHRWIVKLHDAIEATVSRLALVLAASALLLFFDFGSWVLGPRRFGSTTFWSSAG